MELDVLYYLEVKNMISPTTRSYRSKKWYWICFSHNYAKINIDSYDYLSLAKTLAFYNFIILIKSIWNKDQNHYYYIIFSEKCYY